MSKHPRVQIRRTEFGHYGFRWVQLPSCGPSRELHTGVVQRTQGLSQVVRRFVSNESQRTPNWTLHADGQRSGMEDGLFDGALQEWKGHQILLGVQLLDDQHD